MKMYEVGGCVRDEILGVPSKDIDFTVVLGEYEKIFCLQDQIGPFDLMVRELKRQGFNIFLETPEFLTVRAKFPKNSEFAGTTADFVLARKESDYTDGRRPDKVEPGTLWDDLARRDFTMNAIAKDAAGFYIDPFNGQEHIRRGLIVAVGDPLERLREDALRAVRAVRFAVTKGFKIDDHPDRYRFSLMTALEAPVVLDAIRNKISDERIQVELSKMFRYDTTASLKMLTKFPALTEAVFSGRVSLDATMKQKGRG
jgi:tRNA nucleotidyltransferase/poly(A) polymerase